MDSTKQVNVPEGPAWSRFSMRSLLVVMTVLALVLAWRGNLRVQAQRERHFLTQLQTLGVRYSFDPRFAADLLPNPYSARPAILRMMFGSDAVNHIEAAELNGRRAVKAHDLSCLANLSALKHLRLAELGSTDNALDYVTEICGLETLELSGVILKPESIRRLRKCEKMRSLSLSGGTVTDATLGELASLSQLRNLRLHGTGITSAGLAQLAGLQQLQSLAIVDAAAVDDSGLRHLGRLARLEYLELSGTSISDRGLAELARLRDLRWLNLNTTLVSGSGLQVLVALPHLVGLELVGTHVGDEELAALAAFKPLRHLRLGNPAITDAGVGAIMALSRLESLGIFPTQISDAGFLRLRSLNKLRFLSVGPQVTPTGLVSFRRSMPTCNLELRNRDGTIRMVLGSSLFR